MMGLLILQVYLGQLTLKKVEQKTNLKVMSLEVPTLVCLKWGSDSLSCPSL
jgi:hypothetical protein